MDAELSRQLWEQIPDAILAVSSQGEVLSWNGAAEKIFGYTQTEALGKSLGQLIVPSESAGEELRLHLEALETEREIYECIRCRKDGTLVHVSVSSKPMRDASGALKFVLYAKRDITRFKVLQEAALLKARFHGLLESSPDAMLIVERAGRIAMINSQAEALFGYSRAELTGQPIEMLLPERHRIKHSAYRAKFLLHPKTRSIGAGLELNALRRDGTEFPVEISLSPLETPEGLFISSAIRDTTVRKRYEAALQEANRMKSVFLANMSHELRTPLHGILGFSELLIDEKAGAINPKQKEYLADILTSGRHLLQLINDVLDLSKVEAGRMELHLEHFAPGRAIDEVCSVLSSLAARKKIEITKTVPPAIPEVFLDRSKFVQVLYNLLANAIKFTDEARRVTVSIDMPHPAELRLIVSDAGIGIRPEDFSKLFVEFQQLDSGSARRYGGTGLGLALTKKLVEFQNGTIAVTSEKGRGSTFTVSLPLSSSP
jgi:PAS domain S-box-containing protein